MNSAWSNCQIEISKNFTMKLQRYRDYVIRVCGKCLILFGFYILLKKKVSYHKNFILSSFSLFQFKYCTCKHISDYRKLLNVMLITLQRNFGKLFILVENLRKGWCWIKQRRLRINFKKERILILGKKIKQFNKRKRWIFRKIVKHFSLMHNFSFLQKLEISSWKSQFFIFNPVKIILKIIENILETF